MVIGEQAPILSLGWDVNRDANTFDRRKIKHPAAGTPLAA
jgi:hypothetical protein